tara:strand:- start:67 stop:549 length:483 start_codon:yes stop_codon:yes gene_type:complete
MESEEDVCETTVTPSFPKESYFQKLPMWVIDWYRANNIKTKNLLHNKISPLIYTKDELDVANILVQELCNNKNTYKRIPPKAEKICNVCGDKKIVNSAKQFCDREGCVGKMKLISKTKKEAKRKPPKCKKECLKCKVTFESVATALQKCKDCGEKLYIIK